MKDALKVENLNYKKILKNINFSIKEGTFNILIGPSGSGKTTLLKSVFGLLEYNGVISINDLIVEQKNFQKLRKKIGIYLGIEVLENKSVFLNTIEPLKNLDYKEDISKKKVYSITKKIGIENLLYKEVSELSYSEKKVVAFVQSIIHEPDIILIDNIFDSLDIYYKNKILKYLKQINKKCTILLVTNNTEDLIYADNILILKNGKLNEIGPLEELLKQENIFSKNELKLPFVIDLSYKLNAYDLIDKIIYDVDEMVDEIWR